MASLNQLSRSAANWLRLALRLKEDFLWWRAQGGGTRYSHIAFRSFPFRAHPRLHLDFGLFDFDASLGFPGKGPWGFPVILHPCRPRPTATQHAAHVRTSHVPLHFPGLWIFSFLRISTAGLLDFWIFSDPTWLLLWLCTASGFTAGSHPLSNTINTFWVFVTWGAAYGALDASHGAALHPRDARDKRRAQSRAGAILPTGRLVLGQTQHYRDKLLEQFGAWLEGQGLTVDVLLDSGATDIETLNLVLEKYGRALHAAGRPHGHYSETINGVVGRKPCLRRQVQAAWDLAYGWLRQEPPVHHLALPWQALLAILSTALCWGWTRVAGIVALSSLRRHLVLPSDLGWSVPYALLEISEPKTRFSAARHQSARLDQPELLRVIELAFRKLRPDQRLGPMSGQTMRVRFQKLLEATGIASLSSGMRGLDLGSLRAGGASWLLLTSEDSELTRRRGRWVTHRVMEIYVQEISSLQFLPNLPQQIRQLILDGVAIFPHVLEKAEWFVLAEVPESIWYTLYKNEAAESLPQDERGRGEAGRKFQAIQRSDGSNGPVQHPSGVKQKRPLQLKGYIKLIGCSPK